MDNIEFNIDEIKNNIQILCNENISLKCKVKILYKLKNDITGIYSIKICNIIINIKGQNDIFDVFTCLKYQFRKYLYFSNDLIYFNLFLQIFNKVIKNFDMKYKNFIIYRVQKNKIIETLFYCCSREILGNENTSLNAFKNLNAKIMLKLIKYINFKYFINKINISDETLTNMFFTKEKYIKILSLKLYLYIWKYRHNLVIENIEIYNPNLFFCLELFDYFNKNLKSLESIELLYYMIDVLNENQLKLFFDQIKFDNILSNRITLLQPVSFFVSKIFQIKNEGNILLKNIKIQNEINELEKLNIQKDINVTQNFDNIIFNLYNNKLFTNVINRVDEITKDISLSNIVKFGKKIKKNIKFNDYFFSNMPHKENLGKKLIEILNSNESGRIFIGIDKFIIRGVLINRIKRDCFRAEFDQLIKRNIIPSVQKNIIEFPKFYFVEDRYTIKNSKTVNNLCIIKIKIEFKSKSTITYSWI